MTDCPSLIQLVCFEFYWQLDPALFWHGTSRALRECCTTVSLLLFSCLFMCTARDRQANVYRCIGASTDCECCACPCYLSIPSSHQLNFATMLHWRCSDCSGLFAASTFFCFVYCISMRQCRCRFSDASIVNCVMSCCLN